MKTKLWGTMFKESGGDSDEILAGAVEKIPIELEEKISTLDKPLIIECASPGWQPRMWPPMKAYPLQKPVGYQEGGIRYSAVPCTIEEQAKVIIEAAKAGCALSHIHPRDPKDCLPTINLGFLAAIYDKIFESCDIVSSQHTWKVKEDATIDYREDLEALLEMGKGNRYCQAVCVLWPPGDSYPNGYKKLVRETIPFMEANHIKPVLKVRSSYHAREMKRVLIDSGVIKEEPIIVGHDMGHPRGWPMDLDPWMPIDLVTSIMQTKQRIPNSIIGVYSGGRNWMPITMMAIMAGVDIVRVGIEDCYWMYPHRDEVIQRNIDAVNRIVTFCNLIGRKLATPEEARKIMGFRRTS